MGCVSSNQTCLSSQYASWLYQNVGGENFAVGYWTMTPTPNSSSGVWGVTNGANVYGYNVNYYDYFGSVRPVINLLKSAIE